MEHLEAASGTEPVHTLQLLSPGNVVVGPTSAAMGMILGQQAKRRRLRASAYFSLLKFAQSVSCTTTTTKESGRCSFKLSSLGNIERHPRERWEWILNANGFPTQAVIVTGVLPLPWLRSNLALVPPRGIHDRG